MAQSENRKNLKKILYPIKVLRNMAWKEERKEKDLCTQTGNKRPVVLMAPLRLLLLLRYTVCTLFISV